MTAPEPEVHAFHLGDILSVTTGLFFGTNGLDGISELLAHMTGESPLTHQLPRFGDECGPALKAQLPFLAAITCPDEDDGEPAIRAWLDALIAEHGEMHPVTPLEPGAHQRRNPLAELAEKLGTGR